MFVSVASVFFFFFFFFLVFVIVAFLGNFIWEGCACASLGSFFGKLFLKLLSH